MHISADTHVFVVKQSWIDNYGLRDKSEETERLLKELEAIRAKLARLQDSDGPPKCYSCGALFQPKMLCHSKPIGPGRRQIRCVSCAVRHGLITYTEYQFLVLGLEKHNRLTPEVIATAKQR